MNSQLVIQAILTVVLALLMVHTARRRRRGEITAMQLVVWEAFWTLGVVFVFFPDSATMIAHRVGVGRGVDLIMYGSVVTLFYAVFRLIVKIERLNRDITEMVRLNAIEAYRQQSAARTPAGGAHADA